MMATTPIQLGGLLDASVFGVPMLVVLVVGGLAALVAGAVIRVQMEGVRRSRGDPLPPTGVDGGRASRAATREGEPDGPERIAGGPAAERADRRRTDPEGADAQTEAAGEEGPPELIETAASRYRNGEFDGAVQAAYMFVRVRLGEELDVSTEGTHWDFFRRCAEAGLAGGDGSLRELTEVYEQAAFGSRPSSEDEAERALRLMAELTDVAVPDLVRGG